MSAFIRAEGEEGIAEMLKRHEVGSIASMGRSDYALVFFVVGVLGLPILIRQELFGSLVFFNPFLLIAILLCMPLTQLLRLRVHELLLLLLAIAMAGLAFTSNLKAGYGLTTCLRAFLTLSLPLFVLAFWRFVHIRDTLVVKCLKVFNVLMIGLSLWGAVNLVTSGSLSMLLYGFASNYMDYRNLDRLYTPYGHPLYNAFLFLCFFSLNSIRIKKGKGLLPRAVVILVTAVGVLATVSKSAFLIFALLLIVWYISDIKAALLIVLLTLAFVFFGGFDLVLSRFSESLTSGRLETWDLLQQMGYLPAFSLLSGQGITEAFDMEASSISWASSAFEFPVLGYLLSYGIIYTIGFYVLVLLLPGYVLCKKRKWDHLIAFLALSLHMNTYNGMYLIGDYLGVFVLLAVFLVAYDDERIKCP